MRLHAVVYHYDWSQVENPAARFENPVASHLLKWAHHLEDTQDRNIELRYYRDTEQREVDFVITENSQPIVFVECKLSEKSIAQNLRYLKEKFPKVNQGKSKLR